jgi:hypothetical protein
VLSHAFWRPSLCAYERFAATKILQSQKRILTAQAKKEKYIEPFPKLQFLGKALLLRYF